MPLPVYVKVISNYLFCKHENSFLNYQANHDIGTRFGEVLVFKQFRITLFQKSVLVTGIKLFDS